MAHSTAGYSNRWDGPADRDDERPRYRKRWHPAWIVMTVLGFIVWWPVGLALLFFTLGGRNMGCWDRGGRFDRKMERMREKMERRFTGGSETSGNRAFDEYRVETLKRLEDEQREFKDFLERLRHAKDKEEFDQFMTQQRSRPAPSPTDRPAEH